MCRLPRVTGEVLWASTKLKQRADERQRVTICVGTAYFELIGAECARGASAYDTADCAITGDHALRDCAAGACSESRVERFHENAGNVPIEFLSQTAGCKGHAIGLLKTRRGVPPLRNRSIAPGASERYGVLAEGHDDRGSVRNGGRGRRRLRRRRRRA